MSKKKIETYETKTTRYETNDITGWHSYTSDKYQYQLTLSVKKKKMYSDWYGMGEGTITATRDDDTDSVNIAVLFINTPKNKDTILNYNLKDKNIWNSYYATNDNDYNRSMRNNSIALCLVYNGKLVTSFYYHNNIYYEAGLGYDRQKFNQGAGHGSYMLDSEDTITFDSVTIETTQDLHLFEALFLSTNILKTDKIIIRKNVNIDDIISISRFYAEIKDPSNIVIEEGNKKLSCENYCVVAKNDFDDSRSIIKGLDGFDGKLPNAKYICDSAFEGVKGFKTLDIPDELTSIGSGAFKDCIDLEIINIPATRDLTNNITIYDKAFNGCKNIDIEKSNLEKLITDGIISPPWEKQLQYLDPEVALKLYEKCNLGIDYFASKVLPEGCVVYSTIRNKSKRVRESFAMWRYIDYTKDYDALLEDVIAGKLEFEFAFGKDRAEIKNSDDLYKIISAPTFNNTKSAQMGTVKRVDASIAQILLYHYKLVNSECALYLVELLASSEYNGWKDVNYFIKKMQALYKENKVQELDDAVKLLIECLK